MQENERNINANECQLPSTITIAEGMPLLKSLRQFMKNMVGERQIAAIRRYINKPKEISTPPAEPVIIVPPVPLKAGDLVRVRTEEEIVATLDSNGKLKGCGFMKNNKQHQYCGSVQRVYDTVNQFIDERDMSKARKAKGLVMLEGVMCEGGVGIGRCDRSCLMFWREEWLEKMEPNQLENQGIKSKPQGKIVSYPKAAANIYSKALETGDLVRIKSEKEIVATLDRYGKLKGCSFIRSMAPYCESQQRIFKRMERFFSEIDGQVKKCSGLFILDGVACNGDTSLGRCERSCLMFWREEWLEKVQ